MKMIPTLAAYSFSKRKWRDFSLTIQNLLTKTSYRMNQKNRGQDKKMKGVRPIVI